MSANRNRKGGIVSGDIFRNHFADGPHPECPERLDAVDAGLQSAGIPDDATVIPLRKAEYSELSRVHRPALLDHIMRSLSEGSGYLDADTYFSTGSRQAALCAAGSGIDLAKAVHSRTVDFGFAAVRPPGHHATPTRSMGFCIFNNIALAAEALLTDTDAERIAVFDWDVHHGNGTQDAFYDRADVLFCSTHQWPHYPGTGLVDEIGRGEGLGRTINFPFPAGTGEADYLHAVDHIFDPVCREFKPDHILVSAGFDAHRDDQLSHMNLTSASFGLLASRLCLLADSLCHGRITLFLEGGYNLKALEESVAFTGAALLRRDIEIPASATAPSRAGERLITDLRNRLKPFWKSVL